MACSMKDSDASERVDSKLRPLRKLYRRAADTYQNLKWIYGQAFEALRKGALRELQIRTSKEFSTEPQDRKNRVI